MQPRRETLVRPAIVLHHYNTATLFLLNSQISKKK